MVVTALKISFDKKGKPREVIYRNYKGFNETKCKRKLKSALMYNEITIYNSLEIVFLQVLNIA